MDLTLDYHAHILPGCDHGSDGLGTSLQQISMAKEAGILTICATPHFYPDQESIENFLIRRDACFRMLRSHLGDQDPEVVPGAEVLICEGMEKMEGLERLCREGTKELLLEMPFYRWPGNIRDTLSALCRQEQIRIVIAHADRYPPEDIEKLIRAGVTLQLNADSLLKPLCRRRYLSWIQAGYVSYLGSDIHMLGSGYSDWLHCRKIINRRL